MPGPHLNTDTVIKGLVDGKPKYEIAKEAGSKAKSKQSLANTISVHMQTEQFKKKQKAFLQRLKGHVDEIMDAMERQDLSAVEYRDKVAALDKLTAKIELLEGRPTERLDVSVDAVKNFLNNA